ncbi:flavodoxin [Heyndrickxia ginsengihumi]|uniref:flavodoxin n=1 Tax=Heyndrickxia ginsengihumi TaxID=363870 RepID=UPI0004AD08FD|nr:flavodoxin [Heyndrickxia ginsengihumi]MBE6184775.1 flavodoxin [Bacillus sp. (in: firmicutes)]
MKMFIGYISMSGNTEDIATILKDVLLENGCEVKMDYLDDIEIETILDYDCVFIGSYTWGDGDLPYEAEDVYEEMNALNLKGVHAACFGSGDTIYPEFCGAVDIFAETLEKRGGEVFKERLKIELTPDSDEEINECKQFAQSVYEWVLAKKNVNQV